MLEKGYMCAEGFAFTSKLHSLLRIETIGPSELFLGKKRISHILIYFSLPLNEIQNGMSHFSMYRHT